MDMRSSAVVLMKLYLLSLVWLLLLTCSQANPMHRINSRELSKLQQIEDENTPMSFYPDVAAAFDLLDSEDLIEIGDFVKQLVLHKIEQKQSAAEQYLDTGSSISKRYGPVRKRNRLDELLAKLSKLTGRDGLFHGGARPMRFGAGRK